MDKVRTGIKDVYEQIDEYEYNHINPYKQMIDSIRHQYPEATITKVKTDYINIGSLIVPTLTIYYVTG